MTQRSAREFLAELGIEEVVIQKFEEEDVKTVDDLINLTPENLKDDFSLKIGTQNRIRSGIEKLKSTGVPKVVEPVVISKVVEPVVISSVKEEKEETKVQPKP
jgi:protein-tyrosine-phosphatase